MRKNLFVGFTSGHIFQGNNLHDVMSKYPKHRINGVAFYHFPADTEEVQHHGRGYMINPETIDGEIEHVDWGDGEHDGSGI